MENENMPSVAQTEEESTDLNTVEEQGDSTETPAENQVQEEEESEPQEDVEELKSRLAKAEEEKENQRIRAEKAEKEAKKHKSESRPKGVDLTSKDTIALINAKVNEEDVDDIVEYAKFKGISVGEALKTSVVKTMLSEKEEHRATALATNTSKRRSGATRASGESLLERVHKTGELPDSEEDIAKLAEARFKR